MVTRSLVTECLQKVASRYVELPRGIYISQPLLDSLAPFCQGAITSKRDIAALKILTQGALEQIVDITQTPSAQGIGCSLLVQKTLAQLKDGAPMSTATLVNTLRNFALAAGIHKWRQGPKGAGAAAYLATQLANAAFGNKHGRGRQQFAMPTLEQATAYFLSIAHVHTVACNPTATNSKVTAVVAALHAANNITR